MAGQVDQRVPVRRRAVVDTELIVVGQGESDGDEEVARVALLAVPAQIAEFERLGIGVIDLPDHLVEPTQPAVKMVRAVVLGEFVFHAVQREPALCDPVPVSADQRSEVGVVAAQVLLQAVEAEDDIAAPAGTVGRVERDDGPAVGHDGGFNAVGIRQGIELDGGSIRGLSELLSVHVRPSLYSPNSTVFLSSPWASEPGPDGGRKLAAARSRDRTPVGMVGADVSMATRQWVGAGRRPLARAPGCAGNGHCDPGRN